MSIITAMNTAKELEDKKQEENASATKAALAKIKKPSKKGEEGSEEFVGPDSINRIPTEPQDLGGTGSGGPLDVTPTKRKEL